VQKLQAPVVTMTFQDRATVFVKQARGAMVRHIVKERAKAPADCKSFTGARGEWAFVPAKSTDSNFVFIRGAAIADPPKQVGKAKGRKVVEQADKTNAKQKRQRTAEQEGVKVFSARTRSASMKTRSEA